MRLGTRQQWFFEKVDQRGPDECWEWKAGKNPRGYGVFGVGAKRAHRVIWEWEHGPIPVGMFVMHKCDNPGCVNPNHLSLGTHQDNMRDRCAKGRTLRGENSNAAKLSGADVARIREATLFGAKSTDLAAIYDVTRETIRNIIRGYTWVATQGV